MRIRAIRPMVCGPNLSLGAGEERELPDSQAILYIATGKARRIDSLPTPQPEVATVQPHHETASVAPNKGATRRKSKP